ncbi:unnamed protein product, partial [Effrenium voratum]
MFTRRFRSEQASSQDPEPEVDAFRLFGDEKVGAKCEPREGFQNTVHEMLQGSARPWRRRPSLQRFFSFPLQIPLSESDELMTSFHFRRMRSEGGEECGYPDPALLVKEDSNLTLDFVDDEKIANRVCGSDNTISTTYSASPETPQNGPGDWRFEPLPVSRCTSELWAPESTLILIDWDDTLFPTTWLESKQAFKKSSLMGPNPEVNLKPEDLAVLQELDQTASSLVLAASELGHICCVTLAQRPWQDVSMKVFMPKLYETWKELEIPVSYASEEPVEGRLGSSGPAAKAILKDADEIDQLFQQQQVAKKMKAMDKVIRRYFGNTWKNLLSIGDGEAEWDAIHELTFNHDNPVSAR